MLHTNGYKLKSWKAQSQRRRNPRPLGRGGCQDPVLGQFLGFLARGIASHPEHLQVFDSSFVQRIQSLTGGIEVDLDAHLLADYE